MLILAIYHLKKHTLVSQQKSLARLCSVYTVQCTKVYVTNYRCVQQIDMYCNSRIQVPAPSHREIIPLLYKQLIIYVPERDIMHFTDSP